MPDNLRATGQLTNTGTKPGTPTCQINARDRATPINGFDEVTVESSIATNKTTEFADHVAIILQGGQYATRMTVSCS